MRRVAVTGLGVVTSLGVGADEVWRALLDGRSGIRPVRSFDTSRFAVHLGGEVEVDPTPYVSRLSPEAIGRASLLAIAAARLAVAHAELDFVAQDAARAAVFIGTTSGESLLVERFDDAYLGNRVHEVASQFVAAYPSNAIAAHVGRELGITGANFTLPAACAAGNYAIAYGFDTLRAGRADVVLAGGADAFSRITYSGFARLGAIAPERCQPFDRGRKGMVPAEGAAILVLEPLDRAIARGARVFAEVAGYGLSCDAYHMTAGHPEGDGAVRAATRALRSAAVDVDEVSYVSAHGTGTALSDRLETLAMKRVLGTAAYAVPISSVKSMLGHAMGAASAIEAAVCTLAVATDRIPPTINLESPDPDCDLDFVPNVARAHRVDVALNNAYAFGGTNTSVVFRKAER
jgi:3-oxoacyl-[acyl-carrier-protein] synthase II